MRTPLHEGWTVTAVGGQAPDELFGREVPATVPGYATTDLLTAGLIPDPYLDDNESVLAWIGRTEWQFKTRFDADPAGAGERVDLVCDGLDTVATVELNGVVVGRTANMHRSYRLDVGSALRAGGNDLRITFAAPVPEADKRSEQIGPRPHVERHPFNAIRKMACAYGWDWGPDLASSGIWRSIGLDRWRVARLGSVRALAGVADLAVPGPDGRPTRGHGRVTVHVDIERAPGESGPLSVAARIDTAAGPVSAAGTVPAGSDTASVELDVPDAELWWPAGYGGQALSEVEVQLLPAGAESGGGGAGTGAEGAEADAGAGGGGALDRWSGRVGFRALTLDVTPDEVGTAVGLVVNGVPITARGGNWIPEDCFPTRIGRDLYRRRLSDAVEANVNLVRVWGGGIYESEDFYDATDELGLLVWQDFLFACAAYSEEEPLRSEVIAEATEAVTRLSHRASLAVWNGCNENIWGHEDWGWKEPLGDLTWGAGYYFDVLPGIVSRLDPDRPYSAGSPWSFGVDAHPNDPRHGTMHVWDVWNQRDYTAYADYRPRFVSEFGFQGPPAWTTLTRAVHEEPRRPDGPVLLVHQKAADGNGKLARGMAPHLPEPTTFEDWHWATSLNQARAVAFGIERWRSIQPRCTGFVVWQLNDCWPVVSWAAVDGDGRRKPLWYALRRSFADHLLTIQKGEGGLELVAINDGPLTWTTAVELTRQDFYGQELAKDVVQVEVPAGGLVITALSAELAEAGEATAEVLIATAGQSTPGHLSPERALWLWAEDKDLALPPPALQVAVLPEPGGLAVTVTAPTLQRDVAILADRIAPDAVVDDMLVTLPAGASTTFHVRGADLDPAAATRPDVLRSVNQLRHPGSGR